MRTQPKLTPVIALSLSALVMSIGLIIKFSSRSGGTSIPPHPIEGSAGPNVITAPSRQSAGAANISNPGAAATDPIPKASLFHTPNVVAAPAPQAPSVVTAPFSQLGKVADAPTTAELKGCYVQKFKHRKLATHSDGEECLRHRNLVRIVHEGIKPERMASICVRVNGRAVRFSRTQDHPEHLILGPEAGPDAEISVRYCVGKAKCPEDCRVQPDEFMAALTGEAEGHGWDHSAEGRAADQALESEMAGLKKDMGESDSDGGAFAGWESDRQAIPQSCTAQNISEKGRTVAQAR